MFTGIVEEIGIVEKASKGKLMHLVIRAQKVLPQTKPGDSINVNGACLTVVNLDKKRVEFNVIAESQANTNLSMLKAGDNVNLERALSVNSRLGGHIVSGHIDGVGIVKEKVKKQDEFWLNINADKDILSYLVPKGSVAIDGVSLTVVNVGKDYFSVALIPHTLKNTTLSFKGPKAKLNLEVDMFSKYVFNYFEKQKASGSKVSESYLKKMGFDE